MIPETDCVDWPADPTPNVPGRLMVVMPGLFKLPPPPEVGLGFSVITGSKVGRVDCGRFMVGCNVFGESTSVVGAGSCVGVPVLGALPGPSEVPSFGKVMAPELVGINGPDSTVVVR